MVVIWVYCGVLWKKTQKLSTQFLNPGYDWIVEHTFQMKLYIKANRHKQVNSGWYERSNGFDCDNW